MRTIALLAATLGLATCALTQSFQGTAEIVFGRYLDDLGQWRSIEKLTIPVTFERIKARSTQDPRTPRQNRKGDEESPADATVYMNDRASNYFYTPEMASALDDLNTLPSGNNIKWRNLTLGVNTDRVSGTVMLRLRAWNQFTAGLGAGISAFSNEIWDYGIGINTAQFGTPGAYKFTLPLYTNSLINMRVPNGLAYFGQQWREYNSMGEGAFLVNEMSPIFSGDGAPQIGSSEDIFWYDYDPSPNGVYDETEQDFYDGPPNEANFLLTATIAQSGTQETYKPFSFAWIRGTANGGNVGSLHFDDGNNLKGLKGIVANQSESPLQCEFESIASTTNLTAMSIEVASYVSSPGLQQIVQAYNFTTSQYVTIDTRNAPTVEAFITVDVPSNPSQYVQPGTNTVRAKISYRKIGPTNGAIWGCNIDLANWRVIRP